MHRFILSMTALAIHRAPTNAITLPAPRTPIGIRQAVASDVKFIDDLQRKHGKMVGWFPKNQLETNIAKGRVLIAEKNGTSTLRVESPDAERRGTTPVGYCISTDRYFKRDDCGVVYQLNIAPDKQRGLIGASLSLAIDAQANAFIEGCLMPSCLF